MANLPQTNALGYLIGGGGNEAMIVTARGFDGSIRTIAEVRRGLACECSCLQCGGRLVAKKGKIIAPHFAHCSDESCDGLETQAHLFAKAVIEGAKSLHLPSIQEFGQIEEKAQAFDRVELEKNYSDYRPDLIAWKGDRNLIIEIKVTHGVGREKTTWLLENKLSCVEIDLANWKHKPNEEIALAVLRTAPRRWVSHRSKTVPKAPAPMGKINFSSGTGSPCRVPSNTAWYAEQTAKEFPDLGKAWRDARKRWGL